MEIETLKFRCYPNNFDTPNITTSEKRWLKVKKYLDENIPFNIVKYNKAMGVAFRLEHPYTRELILESFAHGRSSPWIGALKSIAAQFDALGHQGKELI